MPVDALEPLQQRADLDRVLTRFLAPAGDQRYLLLEGEPGIGKSTAWGIAVDRAWRSGMTVLACRGAESETELAFCALGDLLDGELDRLESVLPPATTAALEAALLRHTEPTVVHSEREVALAVTAALRALSTDRELLVAVDDVQWIDRPTEAALSFAMRRLGHAQVRMLLSGRLTEDGRRPAPVVRMWDPLPSDRRISLQLGGFPATAVSRIVATRLGVTLSTRAAHDLTERVGGNPFWALELAAAMADTGPQAGRLPLQSSRFALLQRRVTDLPNQVHMALATVAALSRPSLDKTIAALRDFVTDPESSIDSAVHAGMLTESAGMLRPAHPLLGSAALQLIPPFRRRRMHVRFAELATDPEQLALHRALAAPEQPDSGIAACLSDAVEHARRRGAGYVAADLADRAVAMTPVSDVRGLAERRLTAAELNFSTGDLSVACRHAEGVWEQRDVVLDWTRLLGLLVELTYWVHGRPAAQAYVAEVLDRYPADHPRRLVALALGADVGDGRGIPREELALQAVALADRLPDPDPWAVGTALVYLASARLDRGDGIDHPSLDRARAAEAELQLRRPHWTPVINRASSNLAYFYKIVDDLPASRRELLRCIDTAVAEGDDGSLAALFGHLALTECWAADYPAARRAVELGQERAQFGGGVVPVVLHAARALTLLHTGDLAGARSVLAEQLPDPSHPPESIKGVVMLHASGLAHLLDGGIDTALVQLTAAHALALDLGIVEPGRRQRLEGDLGDALAAGGRWDELAELAASQLEFGRARQRPLIIGVGLRLSALVSSARGQGERGIEQARAAVSEHEAAGFPLDLARSLLVLARVLRRHRARQRAAAASGAAIQLLTDLGADGWLTAVRRQEYRITPVHTADQLTAAENKVAALVASGLTNREVASRLFVSVRTVEGHLALIYRKLGVRSRTELVHQFSTGARALTTDRRTSS